MRYSLFFAILGVFIFSSMVSAGIVQTEQYKGHTYFLLEMDSWSSSQSYAASLGSNLLTVQDYEEFLWVYYTFKDTAMNHRANSLWIGLYDVGNSWQWSSGGTSTYRNWDSEEPGEGSYAAIYLPSHYDMSVTPGKWHSLSDSGGQWDHVMGIAETPEPATMTLFGIGIFAVAGLRRRRCG